MDKFNFKKKNQLQSQHDQDEQKNDLTQRKCFSCGWGVSMNADICENCGEWLLKGKCNFCYADIEEGQKFCSECGNPPEGITCSSCGKLSHFDFCPQCNKALTEQAKETIELIANSAEFQNLIKINQNETFNTNEKTKQSDIELEKLKTYILKFPEQKSKKKNLFSLYDNPNSKVEDNLKAIEQSKQKVTNEEQNILLQHQKEIQALKLLEDTRNKIYSTNQEARKYFGALKILLPQVIQKRFPIGWICNAYDCTHNGGPQECADPSLGGTWLYETKSETSFKQIEI